MYHLTIRIALVAGLLLGLTGCGQPNDLYAASKTANTYFKVPSSWNEITFEKLSAYEKRTAVGDQVATAKNVIWQVAYTPLKRLSLSQVYSVESFDEPIVVARVRNLDNDEINEISYKVLRNIIYPIETWVKTPDEAPAGFSVVDDYEIADQGVRGIRSIITFNNKGIGVTFDQVAMVSDDRRILYLLLSRCNTTCYTKNQKEIDEIVSSFSVRGKK